MGHFFVFNGKVSSLEQHPHWKTISEIHQRLTQAGYRALIAGGAVRDLLLSRLPKDIDIATNATPDQIAKLFEKTVMVGKEFGVCRVVMDELTIEVATFRKDGPYRDGRHPESIEFSSEKEDALRRDFTINALFYDPKLKEVIDYVGGQTDLMKKIIRTVGDPELRFEEDKLRILRGIRFQAHLNFTMDIKTTEAIRKFSVQIHQVSMERIRDEWQKILLSNNPLLGIQKTYDLGLWSQLFSGFRFQGEVYKRLWSLPLKDPEKSWILWFLVHFEKDFEKIAQLSLAWKHSSQLGKKMIYCSQSLLQLGQMNKVEPVDVALFLSQPNGRLAVEIYQLLYQGQIKEDWFVKLRESQKYFIHGELPPLLINGDDLIQYGFAPGKEIASHLKKLYRIQLTQGITQKEQLLKILNSLPS